MKDMAKRILAIGSTPKKATTKDGVSESIKIWSILNLPKQNQNDANSSQSQSEYIDFEDSQSNTSEINVNEMCLSQDDDSVHSSRTGRS